MMKYQRRSENVEKREEGKVGLDQLSKYLASSRKDTSIDASQKYRWCIAHTCFVRTVSSPRDPLPRGLTVSSRLTYCSSGTSTSRSLYSHVGASAKRWNKKNRRTHRQKQSRSLGPGCGGGGSGGAAGDTAPSRGEIVVRRLLPCTNART